MNTNAFAKFSFKVPDYIATSFSHGRYYKAVLKAGNLSFVSYFVVAQIELF